MSERRKPIQPLNDLSISDDVFIHCLRLLGPCAAWAEALTVGHRIDFNDRNMVQFPVEIAIAFAQEHAKDQGKIGEACRDALATLASFRALNKYLPKEEQG